jgi:hypothetical protein
MNVFRSLNALLERPDDAASDHAAAPFVLIGAVLCVAMYAVAAGFFQGGAAIALAALKIPLIIFGSILLCIPSLYIFTALAGANQSPRQFASAVAGFCGVAGLILLALMPVAWLFSVSTLSLGFMIWLHVFVWLTALAFGQRWLKRSVTSGGAIGLWLVLLLLVSLQMTTYLRPVLWRQSGAPLFELEKQSFFSHLYDASTMKPAPPAPLGQRQAAK